MGKNKNSSPWQVMALSAPAMGGEGLLEILKSVGTDQDQLFEEGLNAALPQVPKHKRITEYGMEAYPKGMFVPKIDRANFPPGETKLGVTSPDATQILINAKVPWGTPQAHATIAHELGHAADINQGHPGSMTVELENIKHPRYAPGPHHRFFPDYGFETGMGQSMSVQRALQEGYPEEILHPDMKQYMPWAFAGPRLATPKKPFVGNPWTYMKAATPK